MQTPAQYIGGEWNAVVKDHRAVRGTLCLAFPDAYSIGMSHHGLQVLYDVMNRRDDWACERAFTPLADMEQLLREHRLPLYSLETFTPLAAFDVLGFTLQYDLCYTNVLTMLDLGGIPLAAEERTLEHPLVIAGGPCAVNPEPMARFIDLFVIGDGEETLPEVCDLWVRVEAVGRATGRRCWPRWPPGCPTSTCRDSTSRRTTADGRPASVVPIRGDVPDADRAGRGGRPGRHSAAAGAGRAVRRVRAGPDRHRDHARLSGQVPLLPEHDHQAAAAVPQGRNDRRRRRWSSTATRATTKSRCCRSPRAIIPSSTN